MDFGVGKLLELFREYFGDRLTKVLVVIIVGAFLLAAIGVVYRLTIGPLATQIEPWLSDANVDLSAILSRIIGLLISAIIVTIIGVVGYRFHERWSTRRLRRELYGQINVMQEQQNDIQKRQIEINALVAEAKGLMTEVEKVKLASELDLALTEARSKLDMEQHQLR